NKVSVDLLVNELLAANPKLQVFLDRLELKPGAAWHQHIFDSLDSSRKVICIYSPAYLKSKICQEEFNIALIRHRESTEAVLLPVLLTTTNLPTYMRLVQYHDATEGERGISHAAAALGPLL
ncbi:MAG: toll/interleukin-1 receptor domain-containing protein, partial [Woeseiales bacterium]